VPLVVAPTHRARAVTIPVSMKRFRSISTLLQAITGLMAVSLVATFAVSAQHAFERRQVAERVFAIAGISRDLFTALQLLRVERGTVNTALETRLTADRRTRGEVATLRRQSADTLDSALAKLEAAGLSETPSAEAAIRSRRDTLATLRDQADAALEQPKDRRPSDLGAQWVGAINKLVDAIDSLFRQLSGDIRTADPLIAEMMQVGELGWAARDPAGTDRMLVGAAVAHARRLTAAQQQRLAELTGRIDEAWMLVEAAASRPTTPPQIAAAVARARALYFDDVRAKRQQIFDDLAAGRRLAVSGAAWVSLSNPGLESLMAVAYTAFDVTKMHAAEQAAEAKRNAYVELSLVGLFALFGVFATVFVAWRVARPVVKIMEAVRSVAEGDLAGVVPYVGRGDEIGQLADALATFRAHAFEKQRLEGELRHKEELRKTAESLRRSQEHLARAQRIAGMGSDARDFRSDVSEWSDETYRIFGVSRETFTPSVDNVLSLLHPDDRPKLLAAREQIRNGVCPAPFEHRIVRPDGAVRVIHRETELYRDEYGNAVSSAGTIHDVTEQRAAQRRQDELERQLLHSQKLDALGTLAGGIAHDLNNTLVPVLGLAKLTQDRLPEGSRERANLAMILKAGERARDLVQRILAFSRKDAPTRHPVDVAPLLRDSLKMLRASLPATVQIDEKIDEVRHVLADPAQLHQIVINLVVNAAQAIGDKMGTISVTLAAAPTGALGTLAPVVHLAVADTGLGMDSATQQRIFEPFFTTKPVGEGTGLGLSVVHGIVLQHGGRITVASAPGEGSRFDVLLPAIADEKDADAHAPRAVA
jgi:PAS domain S-box-containing protein